MAFVKAVSVDELKPGQGRPVEINGKLIAIFNIDGKFHAVDNTCVHRGGPLGEGFVEGNKVTCPWHGWKYDIGTGQADTFPNMKVATYKVKVEGKDVLVEV